METSETDVRYIPQSLNNTKLLKLKMKLHFLGAITALLLKIAGQVATTICPKFIKNPSPDFNNQEANDFMRQKLETETSLMCVKFGTYELKAFLNFYGRFIGLRRSDVTNILHNQYVLFRSEKHSMDRLCHNAGFFPNDKEIGKEYAKLIAEDWELTDLLASYQKEEKYIFSLHLNDHVVTLNLDGYYSPFFWKNPWSSALKNKRILVISPFAETLQKQYEKKDALFQDSNVLPHFASFNIIKAVQSIGGQGSDYKDWFQALQNMKDKMDKINYDIAIIGCGAYGFHLAAHAKRSGKIGIQLGGMTQMLFGIYGERWANDERYAPFINNAWTRPTKQERPAVASEIEGGCYW